MESFQLPLYAFKKANDAEKTECKDQTEIARKFTKVFAFLPLKTARPIFKKFFDSIREKFEFTATVNQILKYEAVQKQLTRVHDLSAGKVYDAVRCASCNRRLGRGSAVASHCGHVFHQECARNGYCPICSVMFNSSPEKMQRQTKLTMVVWDNKVKKKVTPRDLDPPAIGKVTEL